MAPWPQEGQEALRRLLRRAVLRRAARPRALAGAWRTTGRNSPSDGGDMVFSMVFDVFLFPRFLVTLLLFDGFGPIFQKNGVFGDVLKLRQLHLPGKQSKDFQNHLSNLN